MRTLLHPTILLLAAFSGLPAADAPALVTAIPPLRPADITNLPKGVKRLDLFLLMGQSNIQGAAKLPEKQALDSRIVMMHIRNDQWYFAQHPLHFNGDPVTMQASQGKGVGPGLAFADTILAQKPA